MVEKKEVFKQEVKHKGFFTYSDLYNFCYSWFKDGEFDLSEDKYAEKIQAIGKEILIEWTAEKKVTDYYKQIMKIKWHILGMNDAEGTVEGKKVKTNKGEVKISTVGILVMDYEKNWEKSAWLKFLRGVYDKYIVRTTTDEQEGNLFNKSRSFVEDVKSFLNLESQK